jgi:hypothetical protein
LLCVKQARNLGRKQNKKADHVKDVYHILLTTYSDSKLTKNERHIAIQLQ